MTSPCASTKRDPWWPIEYGQECGAGYVPHARITLPGREVFAVQCSDASYAVLLMRDAGLQMMEFTKQIICNDTLELRTTLLALAYPDG